MTGVGLLGERTGQPTLRLITPPADESSQSPAEPLAEVMGFNVHAKVAVEAGDGERLERLCRYLARPPSDVTGHSGDASRN